MKYILSVLFFIITFLVHAQEIRSINGKDFIVHKVEAKETLFGLSRKYDVSLKDIKESNPGLGELKINQEILIPKKSTNNDSSKDIRASKKHKVAAGETLFSISQKYNVDVEEIKKINDIEDNALSIGMELSIPQKGETKDVPKESIGERTGKEHVVKAGETLFSISQKYKVSPEQIVEANKLKSNALSIDQKLIIPGNNQQIQEIAEKPNKKEDKVPDVTKNDDKEESKKKVNEIIDAEEENTESEEEIDIPDPDQKDLKPLETDEFVETIETGVAELIPDTNDTRKYLALHRTIPVNTIIRVRNEINQKEIWARVVGKLPNTGENKDILIKISQAAYDKLGAIDKKFRVTITYIP